jgi:hypothetical protein
MASGVGSAVTSRGGIVTGRGVSAKTNNQRHSLAAEFSPRLFGLIVISVESLLAVNRLYSGVGQRSVVERWGDGRGD